MSDEDKIIQGGDAKAYLWLALLALIGAPARAVDISISAYLLNFLVLCLVLFCGTTIARRMKRESPLRDPVRLLTLVLTMAVLFFPMRSPGTPLWMFAVLFAAMYVAVLAGFLLYKAMAR